ncbi:copper-binding protein [Aquabacterium parvum]|uniref:copper-binding protein n=1 Tax=Aquabacterium parvum TaxID=70584 RepID=UPI0009FB5486|nr:copper-binding protein [Aquabacterium parvum]
MKFKISHSMLGIAYASQVLSTSAWADAGHNHADHDRAFLAWVASIKASEAASGAEATPQDVWREGVVLSVDRQNKLIQIQQKNVPTAKQGDAANEFSIADINLASSIAVGSRVRFQSHLLNKEQVISHLEVLGKQQ